MFDKLPTVPTHGIPLLFKYYHLRTHTAIAALRGAGRNTSPTPAEYRCGAAERRPGGGADTYFCVSHN